MPDKEKTVFISYRRATGGFVARSIYQDLRQNGYDVFFDVESIDSGEFGRIISDQIAARAHFVLVLAPGSLNRCVDPNDWLRQEIEQAIKLQRNIVPVIINGFSFDDQDLSSCGEVGKVKNYNGIPLYNEYFEAAMGKLRERFLKTPEYVTIRPKSKQAKGREKLVASKWRDMPASEYGLIFERLGNAGPWSAKAAKYLQVKGVKLGFYNQYYKGSNWTLSGNITLTPGAKLDTPYVLSLIAHEAFHLQQSIWTRLSIRGELRAWQYQRHVYFELKDKPIGGPGEAYAGTQKYWEELAQLSAGSRVDLIRAQDIMKEIAPSYRSNCMPLYPLPEEIGYFLKQGRVKDAFRVVIYLASCK